MSREVEIKILNIDKDAVISQLRELGAHKVLEARLIILDYDYADRRLKKNQHSRRVRQEGDETFVYGKRRLEKAEYKVSQETRTKAASLEAACATLEAQGLIKIAHKERDRTSYRLGPIRFDIDQWPGLPAYLEVEATSKQLVRRGVELLGYTMKQTTSKTGNDVLRDHGYDVNGGYFEIRF